MVWTLHEFALSLLPDPDPRRLLMRTLLRCTALLALVGSCNLHAAELHIGSWNLGWHQSLQQAQAWIAACTQRFALNDENKWVPDADGPKKGWQLDFRRDDVQWDISVLPPCDIYKAPNFRTVPATLAAYEGRMEQIGRILARAPHLDVIAFQEVSGVEAVSEALGALAADYHVCSYAGFKVQRLAFAWRNSLGGSPADCVVEPAVSLPERPKSEQPRPGLSLTLTIGGQAVRFMNVHLKSGCVSPLASEDNLAGDESACRTLHDQVVPLEAWLEQTQQDAVVFFGDFNRNLWHEHNEAPDAPVRENTDVPATEPLPAGARVRNLLREVNDARPSATKLKLLTAQCDVSDAARALCERSKRHILTDAELNDLRRRDALGCRNPVGLDHVLLSPSLAAGDARKVAIDVFGRSRAPTDEDPRTFLAISDHCPIRARITLPDE